MSAMALINIDVEDLDRGVAFYTAAFGLHVARRFGPSAVELLGAAAPIYLLEKAPRTTAGPATTDTRRYSRHWTPVHLDFVVPELDSALQAAVGAGAVLEVPPVTHAWGKIAQLADPFGHGFCLIEFVGRGYDEIATNAKRA